MSWWLVDILSGLLDANERESLCGDLAESGKSAGAAIWDVLDLILHRQIGLWTEWRPWLAPLGIIARS